MSGRFYNILYIFFVFSEDVQGSCIEFLGELSSDFGGNLLDNKFL